MGSSQIGSNISGKSSSDGFGHASAISKDENVICIGGYKCTDLNSLDNIYLKYLLHFSKKKENE